MFRVLPNQRLLAAITAGVVISTGIIAMSGNPSLSNLNSTSGAPFKITDITFAATGINTSSCSLLNGVVILKIEGLIGNQRLTSVKIGAQEIKLENTYTHAGETTTALIAFPWTQGYEYNVTVTSQTQAKAQVGNIVTPLIAPSNVTIKALTIKGPTVRFTVENHGACNAYVSEVLVSGPTLANNTSILYSPTVIRPQTSSQFNLLAPFVEQVRANYTVTVIAAGSARTYLVAAILLGSGGTPLAKPN